MNLNLKRRCFFINTISIIFLEDVDLFAQLYLYTDNLAYDILKTLHHIGGFSKRIDLKNIYFNTTDKNIFKKRLDTLIEYKLIYLDQNYNSSILLTSKALTILTKKNIKNKISTSLLCDSAFIEQRFLLKLYKEYFYSIVTKESDLINLDTDYYINIFNQNYNKVKEFLYNLKKSNIHLLNLNTVAINATSLFDLTIKFKDFSKYDIYLDNISTIILNKEYIEKLTTDDMTTLNNITKKYSSIYSKNIKYILL